MSKSSPAICPEAETAKKLGYWPGLPRKQVQLLPKNRTWLSLSEKQRDSRFFSEIVGEFSIFFLVLFCP